MNRYKRIEIDEKEVEVMYQYKYKYLYKYPPHIGMREGGTWTDFVSDPPDLAPSAYAAILMDANSGKVWYEKRANEALPIASITKIMTAILAIENGKMTDLVTVGPHAVGVEGSSVQLKLGQKIPLRSLLYALMLRSGNDAAVAIAEYIAGSVPKFANMMNRKAKALGMTHSHFMNPTGLDQTGHYSSARDMAKLTAYAMKNGHFRKIVSTKVITVPWPGEKGGRTFLNKNKLLTLYPYANGVKTGFTKKARRTLVSAAYRDGVQLIGVTLNDPNDWNDAINMFEYGFKQYKLSSFQHQLPCHFRGISVSV
jgi:serine-type D-Ala-D-Ala carboxypeptidase (penicillin-binding protein 5/6)